MPIEMRDCDGGIGNIMESRGLVNDRELIDSLQEYLTRDQGKFKILKYILFDHSAVTKMEITDETVEMIAGLWADASRVHPDPIVAMVAYAAYGASIDLLNIISRLHELFIHQSCWETRMFRTKPQAVRWIREEAKKKFGIDDLSFN